MCRKTYRCPKCGAKEFIATAHVAQDWKLGGNGDFLETIAEYVEATHAPDDDDTWTCASCGYEAAGSMFQEKEGETKCKEINTEMNYLYRSNSNYKQANAIVIKGTITEEQISRILASTIDGESFLPEKIGLPLDRGWEYEEDEDNDFAEISEYSFCVTDRQPTEDMGAEELARRFENAAENGWS